MIAATAGAVLGELAALQQVVVRPCHGIFLTECDGAPFELQTVSVVYMGAAASAPSPSYRKELMAALAEEPGRLDLVVRFHAVTGGSRAYARYRRLPKPRPPRRASPQTCALWIRSRSCTRSLCLP